MAHRTVALFDGPLISGAVELPCFGSLRVRCYRTMRVSVVLWFRFPEAAVTVIEYVCGVNEPPQPLMPAVSAQSAIIPMSQTPNLERKRRTLPSGRSSRVSANTGQLDLCDRGGGDAKPILPGN